MTRARRMAAATIASVAAYAFLLIALPADVPHRAAIADISFLPFHPLAAVLLWSASAVGTDDRRRRGLRLLAWTQVVGSINILIWVLSDLSVVAPDSPAFQYVGALMTALAIAGVALLVPRRAVAGGTVALPFLDASLLAMASLSVGWQLVAAPLLRANLESATSFLWFATMAAGDCFTALLALGAWVYPSRRIRQRSAALLAFAFGLSAWLDVLIEVGTVHGTYVSGHLVDVVSAVSISLMGFVGYLEHREPGIPVAPNKRRVALMRLLLPIVAAAAVVVPLIVASPRPETGMLQFVPWSLLVLFIGLMQWRFVLLEKNAERAITERLALERDLRLSQQFESLGRYAASVAHDFNNLLAALLAQVHVMRFTGAAAGAAAEHVDAMETTMSSGTTLVRRLMQMSRGGTTPAEPIDLKRVARDLAVTVSRLLPTGVQMSLDLTERPVIVTLRPGDADQVLLNLVVNARDALPHGGHIAVALRLEGDRAILSVADNGIGMPPEVQDRIFEPFFTTKPAGSGTGLGLATVMSIANTSRGVIDVASEPNAGTTFTVSWPLHQTGPDETKASRSAE